MYTQCPHCQTIFGVSEAHLSAAFGRVRCGHCREQFNARRHLLDELPQPEPEIKVEEQAQPPVEEPPPPPAEEPPAPPATAEAIPQDEIEHIDLPALGEPPAFEADPGEKTGEEDGALIHIELTAEPQAPEQAPLETPAPDPYKIKPGLFKRQTNDQELDAIFADLDHRLEALSEEADQPLLSPLDKFNVEHKTTVRIDDAFGDPDNQTEEDIKASIESIFAAAEAELAKQQDAGQDEEAVAEEVPLDVFLTEGPDAPPTQAETAPAEEGPSDTPAPNSTDEYEPVDDADYKQQPEPVFEQGELPFALHEELTATPPPRRGILKSLGLLLFIGLLLSGIGLQLALFRNIELAHHFPLLKPYLVEFCQYLPCQFGGQRDVKLIQLTSRDVRSNPENHTILISAIFVNTASFDQPYPDILITLSDLTNSVVAQRRFTPADYLAGADTFQMMRAGKPVHIALEVLDPGNDAVNFQFEFL